MSTLHVYQLPSVEEQFGLTPKVPAKPAAVTVTGTPPSTINWARLIIGIGVVGLVYWGIRVLKKQKEEEEKNKQINKPFKINLP